MKRPARSLTPSLRALAISGGAIAVAVIALAIGAVAMQPVAVSQPIVASELRASTPDADRTIPRTPRPTAPSPAPTESSAELPTAPAPTAPVAGADGDEQYDRSDELKQLAEEQALQDTEALQARLAEEQRLREIDNWRYAAAAADMRLQYAHGELQRLNDLVDVYAANGTLQSSDGEAALNRIAELESWLPGDQAEFDNARAELEARGTYY